MSVAETEKAVKMYEVAPRSGDHVLVESDEYSIDPTNGRLWFRRAGIPVACFVSWEWFRLK